jgi:hypothetical protein
MTTILQQITQLLDNTGNLFIDKINQQYNIDKTELLSIWNEVLSLPIENNNNNVNNTPKNIKIPKPVVSSTMQTTLSGGCPFVLLRGLRKGNNCNSKVASGKTYCNRHQKEENKIVKQVEEKKSDDTMSFIRNNKLKKPWNPINKFVLESNKDKYVIGKYIDNELLDLDKDDIEECKKYGYKYDSKYDNMVEEETLEVQPKYEIKEISFINPDKIMSKLCNITSTIKSKYNNLNEEENEDDNNEEKSEMEEYEYEEVEVDDYEDEEN